MSGIDEVAGSLSLPDFSHLTPRRAASVAPRASAALVGRQQWERRFRRRLRLSDSVTVVLACTVASVSALLATTPHVLIQDPWLLLRVPLSTALVWLLFLSLFSSREPSIMGHGSAEYRRVAHATGMAFGTLAIAYVLFGWDGIRTQLFLALPVGSLALLITRWAARKALIAERDRGRFVSRAVVVGSRDDVEYVVSSFGSSSRLGYQIVGTVLSDVEDATVEICSRSYPSVYGARSAASAASALHADTIIVAGQPHDDSAYIKHLAWELEGTASELVLCSRLADVAGPRMSLRPIEGMPLIHVRIPRFDGGAYVVKRALDIIASTLALVAFAPFAALIALAILIDDGGPVFFQQNRVGRDGREFPMLKFRSMRTSAENELQALLTENEGAGPLFKLRHDPRITRVGAVLRKYSLDEIPQFWNVLRGDMSVVGPRPPLPSEVTAYDGTVFRRLYIKPGITGPWQVGGRSDLSWDESVRLDLRYVENWSVIGDLQIMWRTAKVMIHPEGAY